LTATEPNAEKEMTDSIRKDANRPYFELQSFNKREVLSPLYRSVFFVEMAILLSFGEVSSPHMIVRENMETMMIL
jgi:hypothetical protein